MGTNQNSNDSINNNRTVSKRGLQARYNNGDLQAGSGIITADQPPSSSLNVLGSA